MRLSFPHPLSVRSGLVDIGRGIAYTTRNRGSLYPRCYNRQYVRTWYICICMYSYKYRARALVHYRYIFSRLSTNRYTVLLVANPARGQLNRDPLRFGHARQVRPSRPASDTGGRSHRISPPSFCSACLNFYREKDPAVPFPRRP